MREVIDHSEFFSGKERPDLEKFFQHGGKVLKYEHRGKPGGFFAYIPLAGLRRMAEHRGELVPGATLHVLTGNAKVLEDLKRAYPHVSEDRVFYEHGVTALPVATKAAPGYRLHEKFLKDLDNKKPRSLVFGLIEWSGAPNIPSLGLALRHGFVVDSVAEINPREPEEGETAQPNWFCLRVVRPPEPVKTGIQEIRLPVKGGPEFYNLAAQLTARGFVGVAFDKKNMALVFRKKAEAPAPQGPAPGAQG